MVDDKIVLDAQAAAEGDHHLMMIELYGYEECNECLRSYAPGENCAHC